jgi:glycosyltransferase involved in cell wall biosynthesis
LAKHIDEQNIDVIHFHWNNDMTTVVLAKVFSKRKPDIVLSRHMTMTRFKDDVYHKWLYKHISKIHAVSQQVKEQLVHFIPTSVRPQIELIYLGVDSKKEIDTLPLKKKYALENEFIIGIIGRIQEGKGQHIVIEAIATLKNLNIKLFILGEAMDDTYIKRLHRMCKELDIEDKVIFTGFIKDTDAYMQLCDITVLATGNETFGLVIIESMANGTPVIATDRGGPLEIIDNDIDGLLYNGKAEDLSMKISQLYNDNNKKILLSKNSLKKIDKTFNKAKQLKKLFLYFKQKHT